MTDITQLSKWNRDLSQAIAALGTDAFFPALIAAIQEAERVQPLFRAMKEDVQKAFPSIWVRLACRILGKYGVPAEMLECLQGF